MTKADEKSSSENSKEEQVQTAPDEPSGRAQASDESRPASGLPVPRPAVSGARPTLPGLGLSIPRPDIGAPPADAPRPQGDASAAGDSKDTSNPGEPGKARLTLALSALRARNARQDDEGSAPPARPIVEPALAEASEIEELSAGELLSESEAEVDAPGFDDAAASDVPVSDAPASDAPADIEPQDAPPPIPAVQDAVADDTPEDAPPAPAEASPEGGEFEGEATTVSEGLMAQLDAARDPQRPVRSTLLGMGAVAESGPTPPPVEADDDEFEGEKTQISAGLFGAHPGVDEPAAGGEFEGEKTQIAEELFAQAHETASPEPAPPAAAVEVAPIEVTPIEVTPGEAGEAGDDDFAGEKTELFQSPFESEPICPKITCLQGPATGQEFLVNRMRNTVGRGTTNTIVVPDLAMSRQHFEIVKTLDETFVLRDLQSVNGTFLNGTRIQEADLLHGDRIEAGKTVLQFIIAGATVQPSRARRLIPATDPLAVSTLATGGPHATLAGTLPPHAQTRDSLSKMATYVIIGVGILSIPLIGLIIHLGMSRNANTASTEQVQIAVTASQLYLEGAEAVKSRDWERAHMLFRRTAELEPNFEGVPAQLARIESEQRIEKLIAQADADIEAGRTEQALTQLQTVTTHSVYHGDAQRLVRKARQREVFELYEQAQAAFRRDELDEAEKHLTRLLEFVPGHEGGRTLKAQIDEQRRSPQADAVAAPADSAPAQAVASAPSTASSASSSSSSRSSGSRSSRSTAKIDDDDWSLAPKSSRTSSSSKSKGSGAPAVAINFTEGFSHYRARRFTQAVNHFEGIARATSGTAGQRAEKIATDIRRFERAFGAGSSAIQGGNWAEAVRHLQEANRADRAVGGESGHFEGEINQMLARAYGELGQEAFNEKQFARAFTFLKRGNSHRASEATLQKLSRDLEREAGTLVGRADGLKASDPQQAASICRNVLTMVPPASPHYQRARKLLDELS